MRFILSILSLFLTPFLFVVIYEWQYGQSLEYGRVLFVYGIIFIIYLVITFIGYVTGISE